MRHILKYEGYYSKPRHPPRIATNLAQKGSKLSLAGRKQLLVELQNVNDNIFPRPVKPLQLSQKKLIFDSTSQIPSQFEDRDETTTLASGDDNIEIDTDWNFEFHLEGPGITNEELQDLDVNEHLLELIKVVPLQTIDKPSGNEFRGVRELYACEICPKKFTFKNNLKRHQSIHDEPKPQMCEWCGKMFERRRNLLQHVSRNKFKHKCPSCNFKTHSVLLPHAFCKKCPYTPCAFVTQSFNTLFKHELSCRGQIKCPEEKCTTVFSNPKFTNIKRHYITFHNKCIF